MLLRQGAVQQVQQRSSPTQQQQLRWQHQAAAPRPGRSRAVACVARRTVSGSDAGRSALKRPGSKPSSTPDSKKQPPPQQPAKRQPPASQNGRSSGAQSKQQQQQQSQNAGAGLSDLEVFMRTTPGVCLCTCVFVCVAHHALRGGVQLCTRIQACPPSTC
jgi:hypothetical protein